MCAPPPENPGFYHVPKLVAYKKKKKKIGVSNRFDVLGALGDPLELWDTFKRETLQAAKECIGERPRSRRGFVSMETLEKIEESRAARLAGNRDQHRALSRWTRTLLRRDKERYVRSLTEDVEGHLNANDLRPAYRALKKLRSKSPSRASAIRTADGRLVSDMDGQMARWAEYFGQLFMVDPPTEQLHTTGLQAVDADPPIDETAPSLDEVVDQSDCGASVGNTKITDLVFADDAVIFAESLEVLVMALEALHEEAKPLGLEVSWLKTKVQVFGDLLDEAEGTGEADDSMLPAGVDASRRQQGGQVTGGDIQEVVRIKYNNLKTYYIRKKKQSGLNGETPSKWEWFSALSFLDAVSTTGPSESGLNLNNSNASLQPQQTTSHRCICSTKSENQDTMIEVLDNCLEECGVSSWWVIPHHTDSVPGLDTGVPASSRCVSCSLP
ncbi:hypothetical protein GWK47_045438 [Chionoecetes opilio]|uniref:Reverse transcriptase domain-containing protein n=1 Tax=Chionoecetes opilio TaxID=41210 RepID=A0A8J5CXL5_CHIOP|nr:hypothetical protein GWK47_045438 [Chionoecetes opilio]